MEFAKKELLKYGWQQGSGLGKNNDGITTALKPKLKFDKCGMGHDPAEEFKSRWWENNYKNALQNVEISKVDGEITVSSKCDFKDLEKIQKRVDYNSFLKKSTLTNDGCEVANLEENDSPSKDMKVIPILSDEELFKACGGRTAHKGARHGLKLSGKLARIQAQEDELMLSSIYKNKYVNTSEIDESETNKIKKRRKTEKELDDTPLQDYVETQRAHKKKKKKNDKCKI